VNILFSSKLGIGQHRVGAVGGGNTGQRQSRDPAAVVGQGSGGEEHSQDHGVPGSRADSMIDMTHGADNAPFYDRVVRRKA
jgi:hypothetical protein